MENLNMQLFLIFIALNIVNVIIQTVKSLCTVKCGKGLASIVNALAYGFYTIVVVYMVCDLPLWLKVVVVGACNLAGVFLVKLAEEKSRKDKLWKFEITVPTRKAFDFKRNLQLNGLSFNYIENIGTYTMFNVYCPTQKESQVIKSIVGKNRFKTFVSETQSF